MLFFTFLRLALCSRNNKYSIRHLFLTKSSLHKQPFITAQFSSSLHVFVHHCTLKQALVKGYFVFLSSVVFVRSRPPSVRIHLLQQQLNVTLNFRFHMYDKFFISVTSQALDPSLCHKLLHLLGPPLPLSVTYFMDGPKSD